MTRILVGWLLLTKVIIAAQTTKPSPESLFRETVQQWRSSHRQGYQYQPWNDFAAQILSRFDEEEPITSVSDAPAQTAPRLELIGALEESILMIEKSTLHEGVNRQRDTALSNLYSAYGNTLLQLSAVECHILALDAHTLLIGAETVRATKSTNPPSIHLCVDNAENSLRNAVTLDATNTGAQKLLDLVLKEDNGVHQRRPKEFVAELFDSFAEHFDEKLLKGLNYQVPKLVGEVVKSFSQKRSSQQQFQHALDAGCGTGLAGRFLRPFVAGQLIGVDASQKMLDIAANCTLSKGCGLDNTNNDDASSTVDKDRALYDGLLAMDLESMTVATTLLPYFVGRNSADDAFDLVVAADVLVYFGSLDSIIQTFQEVSVSGGLLVFSCERTTAAEAPMGFRLLPSGRFAHTREHVQEAASKAGYQLRSYQEIVPRQEKGEHVLGHLFAFELAKRKKEDGSSREEL